MRPKRPKGRVWRATRALVASVAFRAGPVGLEWPPLALGAALMPGAQSRGIEPWASACCWSPGHRRSRSRRHPHSCETTRRARMSHSTGEGQR